MTENYNDDYEWWSDEGVITCCQCERPSRAWHWLQRWLLVPITEMILQQLRSHFNTHPQICRHTTLLVFITLITQRWLLSNCAHTFHHTTCARNITPLLYCICAGHWLLRRLQSNHAHIISHIISHIIPYDLHKNTEYTFSVIHGHTHSIHQKQEQEQSRSCHINKHNTEGTVAFVLLHNIRTLSYNITQYHILSHNITQLSYNITRFFIAVALTWASDRVECSYHETSTGCRLNCGTIKLIIGLIIGD